MVGVSRAGVAVKPTPVRVRPDTARAVISWMPWPPSPVTPGELAFQTLPSAEVQMTTSWPPWTPNVPTAVKPPPVAATAVTVAAPLGDGRDASVQVVPPSVEVAAKGVVWPDDAVAVPVATRVWPLTVTRVSSALTAGRGTARVTACQVRPLPEVPAAGAAPGGRRRGPPAGPGPGPPPARSGR